MNSKSNILNVLNEDCMMKIFSYLPLKELVRSERVSKEWKYFVQQKYKSFVEFDNSCIKCGDFHAVHGLLKKIGPNLKTLYLDRCALQARRKKTLRSIVISQNCPNLLEMRIKNVSTTSWRRALKKLKNIKVLEFHKCRNILDNTFEFCSDQLEELTISRTKGHIGLKCVNFTNLKKICIRNTQVKQSTILKNLEKSDKLKQLFLRNILAGDEFIKKVLSLLPNLTHLGLNTMSLSNDSLNKISNLKHLESLQLKQIYQLQDDMIRNICQGCTRIVSLDISITTTTGCLTDSSLEYIWKLKHLEELNVSGHRITSAPFMKLGRSGNGSKLRVLICGSIEITNEAVCHIFMNCPQLEKIDLCNCLNIDSTLIEQIIVISHTNGCQTNRYFVNLPKQCSVENYCSCLKISGVNSQPNYDSDYYGYSTDDNFDDSSSD